MKIKHAEQSSRLRETEHERTEALLRTGLCSKEAQVKNAGKFRMRLDWCGLGAAHVVAAFQATAKLGDSFSAPPIAWPRYYRSR